VWNWSTLRRMAVLAIALLLVGCGGTPSATSTATPISSPTAGATPVPANAGERAARGAPLYLEHCSPCHGIQGQGVDAPPLRNNLYVQNGTDETVGATIADGFPGTEMPGWLQENGGPMTKVQIGFVVAYLRTMQDVPALPATPSSQPGPAASLIGVSEAGRPLFGLYCAACHGPQGLQGIPNPGSTDGSVPVLNPIDPEIASSDPAVFNKNLDVIIEHGSLPPGQGPLLLMPAFGDRGMLSAQQIANLIAYVMDLNGVGQGP
jgi:mono/diheme cytochrome c family protein